MAWRHLGFIPGKLGNFVPRKKFQTKDLAMIRLNDWHHVCAYLLDDFKQMQNKECLLWKINGKEVRLHIPMMMIIGDIEGHDKLCSRKSGHHVSMRGVTHSCDIKREECNDTGKSCKLFLKDEIADLQDKFQNTELSDRVRSSAKETLDEKGFYSGVRNAFFRLDYGANVNGLHGACAICLLHTFKQKFPDLVVDIYLKAFGASEDTVGKLSINRSLPIFIHLCKHQSYRNFPRLNTFTFALTKGTLLLQSFVVTGTILLGLPCSSFKLNH